VLVAQLLLNQQTVLLMAMLAAALVLVVLVLQHSLQAEVVQVKQALLQAGPFHQLAVPQQAVTLTQRAALVLAQQRPLVQVLVEVVALAYTADLLDTTLVK